MSNITIYRFALDMTPGGVTPVVHLSQYDEAFQLEFTLYSRSGELDIPSGATAMIEGTKLDGKAYSANATISENVVTVAGDVQISAVAGNNPFQIVLKSGNSTVGSANFTISVERAAMDYDTVSDSKLAQIQDVTATAAQLTAAAENVTDGVETFEALAESVSDMLADITDDTLSITDKAADAAAVGDALAAEIAPKYSTSATYAVGDYVLYNNALYQCNTAIATAESWTAAHWTAVKVGSELSNLKSDLKYNSFDLIANAPRTVGTNQGIQYTWNKNVCTVVGTATGASQNNIISNGIPADYGFAIGEKYIVKYSSTDIRFRVYCRVNGVFTEVLNTVTDAEFVIPENTSDITIRLTVPNRKTVSEVISPAILNARSNKEIAGEINSIKRTDAGILLPFFASWNAQYNADGKLSLLDMPINSVCYVQFNTILESQVENFPITDFGAIYIEKIGRGNFAFYKIFANNRPHIVYGYYASNKFSWFCNQSIYPLKIGMLGDSVTAGRIGGQTGNTDKGIPYWVMCETGMNVVNLGVGSQGWISKQYLDQNAEEYIQTLDLSSYDVLTFMYGANDGDISLGDYDDTTEQTIMGAVYRCVNYAMTQNPRLRIILINHPLGTSANFPHYNPNTQHSAPDHWTFSQYFEQIRLFGTKYAIPVIDGWRALNAWNRSLYIGDNVHPTIAGYKVVGQYIAGQIKSMI